MGTRYVSSSKERRREPMCGFSILTARIPRVSKTGLAEDNLA